MKKYILLWVLVLCFSFCMSAEASTGSLDILVNEKDEFSFTYTKVADYEDGEFVLTEPFGDSDVNLNDISNGFEMRKAAKVLSAYDVEKTSIKTENQAAQIGPLTEGVYLIEGIPKEGYEISATLVSIPQWDESEDLSYHVTVIPKIQRTITPVETGDDTNIMPLIMLCALSLIIVVGVSGRAYFLKDK